MRPSLFVFVLILFPSAGGVDSACGEEIQSIGRKTKNVIYVTLDGLRWQEVFGGAQKDYVAKDSGVRDIPDIEKRFLKPTAEERRKTLMPFLWNTIAVQGQLFGDPENNARAKITNTMKFSYPGYHEMFAGFADDDLIRSNAKVNNPHKNVLEFLHQRPGFKKKVAAYATWDVIPYILNSQRSGLFVHSGVGPIVDPPLSERQKQLNEMIGDSVVLWNNNGIDLLTMHAALEHLRKHKPRVLYLGLGETDEWGHGRRYDLYLDAARKADQFLERLWSEIQQMPEYQDSTSLVIATDHGRGGTVRDWTDHGQKIEGAEFIWIGVMGPDTPALGVRKNVETTQSQIAGTLAALLGEDFIAFSPKAAAPLPVFGEK